MRFVSYFLIGLGVLLVVAGIVGLRAGGFGSIIQGIIQIIIGIWTGRAASSFQLIVNTQGNDITNLISALGELRKLYVLQYWLLILGLILIGLLTLLAVVSVISSR